MRLIILCISLCTLQIWLASQAHGQFFKFLKKKDKQQGVGFVLEEGITPEEREKAMARQLVNPTRLMLNRFNLQIEKSYGFFNYKNKLEQSNSGTINPLTLRLSFSLKKLDKEHFKTTDEKRYLDEDALRIGGGISFGKIKFRNEIINQEVLPLMGNSTTATKGFSTTQMFGSLTFNFYTQGDFSMLADVKAGVWEIKTSKANNELISYDPFINVGIMLQTTFSKYFKGYIRPSIELRSYSWVNNIFNPTHQFNVFSIDIGLLLKYPSYPRNQYPAHQVQMEHVFNGKMYRGRPFYQKQNPRYGQNRVRRKPLGLPFKRAKDTNEKKKNGKGN